MYSVAVRQAFSASHYLIGDDWGEESKLHQHDYLVEVCLEGQHLDAHFYLADISDIKVRLNGLVDSVRGTILNYLPECTNKNPSIELLATVFCQKLLSHIATNQLSAVTVRIWENENAWAAFRQDI